MLAQSAEGRCMDFKCFCLLTYFGNCHFGTLHTGRQYRRVRCLRRTSTPGGGRRRKATAATGSLALSELRHTP